MRSGTAILKPITTLIFAVVVVTLLLSANYLLDIISFPSFPSFSFRFTPNPQSHNDRLLIVTAYFPLESSKHSHAEYDAWLTHFMGQLDTDMYIFCPPAEEPHLRGLIEQSIAAGLPTDEPLPSDGSLPLSPTPHPERNVYFDTRYADPLSTPVLAEFALRTEEQSSLDPESHIHNPGLYAVWDSKPYFVGEAVRNTTAKGEKPYQYYFWQDAGAMRHPNTLRHWPSINRTEEVFREARATREEVALSREGVSDGLAGGDAGDTLILFPFWRLATPEEKTWGEERGGLPSMLSEGSFFGGSADSVIWFESTFYRLFGKFLSAGQFVGKDQDIFNAVMSQYPSHFFGPTLNQRLWDWNKCGDRWYYYIMWVASAEEREAMEKGSGWDCPLIPGDFPFL